MSFLDWFTRNWADTDEGRDPALVPLSLSLSMPQTLEKIETILSQMSHWNVEKIDREANTLHATRKTRVFRFVDDVFIRLESTSEGTKVHARSQSRKGKGDLGQNKRNIQELFRALQKSAAPEEQS